MVCYNVLCDHLQFIISMVCYNFLCEVMMDTQDVHTSQCPVLGLTSASAWLVYMHVTELHVCKCITWYSKRFFVINTTLTCITQMIIWLCENVDIHLYALGIQRVKIHFSYFFGRTNYCLKGRCLTTPYRIYLALWIDM